MPEPISKPTHSSILLLAGAAGAFWFMTVASLGLTVLFFVDRHEGHGVVQIAAVAFGVITLAVAAVAVILSAMAASRLRRIAG